MASPQPHEQSETAFPSNIYVCKKLSRKFQHYRNCLKAYTLACPNQQCVAHDFLVTYPNLELNCACRNPEKCSSYPAPKEFDLIKIIEKDTEFSYFFENNLLMIKLDCVETMKPTTSDIGRCDGRETEGSQRDQEDLGIPVQIFDLDNGGDLKMISGQQEDFDSESSLGVSLPAQSSCTAETGEPLQHTPLGSWADEVEQEERESKACSRVDSSTLYSSVHATASSSIHSAPEELVRCVISLMNDSSYNKFHGSKSVDSVKMNIQKQFSDLCGKTFCESSSNTQTWVKFLSNFPEEFFIFEQKDPESGRPTSYMALTTHHDYRIGDRQLQDRRNSKRKYILNWLRRFLKSQPGQTAALDLFCSAYDNAHRPFSLPFQGEENPKRFVGEQKWLEAYPIIPRGDLVSLLNKHANEFVFSGRPAFQITLRAQQETYSRGGSRYHPTPTFLPLSQATYHGCTNCTSSSVTLPSRSSTTELVSFEQRDFNPADGCCDPSQSCNSGYALPPPFAENSGYFFSELPSFPDPSCIPQPPLSYPQRVAQQTNMYRKQQYPCQPYNYPCQPYEFPCQPYACHLSFQQHLSQPQVQEGGFSNYWDSC